LKPIQRFVIGLDRSEIENAGYILTQPPVVSISAIMQSREGSPGRLFQIAQTEAATFFNHASERIPGNRNTERADS
jgi:hypothetical protein